MGNILSSRTRKVRSNIRDTGILIALTALLLVLALSACKSSKQMILKAVHYDSRAEGIAFIDSLKAHNIDTIIGYHISCHDCTPYSQQPCYIFWNSNDMWFTAMFTQKKRYGNIKGYAPPIKYLSSSLDTIQNEKWVKPRVKVSSYHAEEVRIIRQDVDFSYVIKHYEKQHNRHTHRVALTDSIRSVLSRIPDTEWKAVN